MEEGDFSSTGTIKRKQIKSQNIVKTLITRENHLYRIGTDTSITRDFYQSIYPNLTVINVEKPSGYLRKFTPDGKYLIGFSYDQTSLEIYEFLGTPAAAELTYSWSSEYVPNIYQHEAYNIRRRIFDRLFRLKKTISVSTLNKQLNRECSLFTNDGKYVIVGAASPILDENRPPFFEIYTTNETLTPTPKNNLEDYSIYLVDIEDGRVTDRIDRNVDKIFLSHNQGIYLYNNTFAILSVLHQTIHIYIIFDGKFIMQEKIGRFCCESDRLLYNDTYSATHHRPYKEETINSLKQRFLVALFRKAKLSYDETGDCFELRKFYQFFDQYKNLRMWKMQLLDENHLLIKYTCEQVLSIKGYDMNSFPAFFAFYSIPDSKMLAVYDNTSKELLNLFENYCDMFRNVQVRSKYQYPCSPSNNIYARLMQQKCKQTIISARGGGAIEATKRLLAHLPISAQSYTCSPYLDLNLFSYDDKWISVMERPKGCGEYPIRFFGRESGLLKFRIYPGLQEHSSPQTARKLIAFTFHPSEPFAISVQRINNEYVVNFHIRNESTILSPQNRRIDIDR